MKNKKENEIVNECCQYLDDQGYFNATWLLPPKFYAIKTSTITTFKGIFWRQNTTPVFNTETKQFRRMGKWSMPGVGDILISDKEGKFIVIECKTEIGVQSEYQKIFELRFTGKYILARSVDDLKREGL